MLRQRVVTALVLLAVLFAWPLLFNPGNKTLLVVDNILIAAIAVLGLKLHPTSQPCSRCQAATFSSLQRAVGSAPRAGAAVIHSNPIAVKNILMATDPRCVYRFQNSPEKDETER